MTFALAAEPSTPSLKAATGMSSSTRRAWRSTHSDSIASRPSTPRVSCTETAVSTDNGWQPRLASVSRSACRPAPPVGSEAAKARTIGGVEDMRGSQEQASSRLL